MLPVVVLRADGLQGNHLASVSNRLAEARRSPIVSDSSRSRARSEPAKSLNKIDSATYTMGAAHDADSRLSKVSYPSGFTARYGYNSLGYANQLVDDATGQSYWTANAMDAEGHLTQMTSGNGLVTARGFDAKTGRLLS